VSEKGDVVRRLFRAVEERQPYVLDCYAENIEIHEAESLPYGGVYRGHAGAQQHIAGWLGTWDRFQTDHERRLEAVFIDGEGDTVAAVFRHKAVDPDSGRRLDAPEVGIYQVRDGKVVRSQMFHADTAALLRFLAETEDPASRGRPPGRPDPG
jgi:ketosteroid isomerase-like protein